MRTQTEQERVRVFSSHVVKSFLSFSVIVNISILYCMVIVAHWLCANTAIVSGKNEVSSVVYKVGECMQELIKLWKEYEVSQGEKNESSLTGPTLEIRIPAEHVTATNRQVRSKLCSYEIGIQCTCFLVFSS